MRSLVGLFVGLALLSAACESNNPLRRERRAPIEPVARQAVPPNPEPTKAPPGGVVQEPAAGPAATPAPGVTAERYPLPKSAPAAAADRKVVLAGELKVEVSRPDEAIAGLRGQVQGWGGHVQRQTDRTVVVRLPAAQFDAAFQWLRGSGRVLTESQQAEDATEEAVDLGVRVDSAKKARDRLLAILQQADKVEDTLKVEAELRRTTEDVERLEGRQRALADRVALATLAVAFQPLVDDPEATRQKRPSRFAWINRVGAERVVEDF
ncbi:MAG: DUF4349 domain-containing protein [Planctomycetes bacterium]|nr:DUF4349 domain-containing protein [Planctomycetota bacterium]